MNSRRLFAVRNIHTKAYANITGTGLRLYTDEKRHAKELRDLRNEGKDKGWRVVLGPDHWRYES
jgi:hypothetical protein